MSAGLLRRQLMAALLAAAALLGGCATAPQAQGQAAGAAPPAPNPADPWENWNRKVFAFNEAVDEAVLKPVATGYRNVVPQLVRTGVSNVFGNLGDVWSAANHFLQGKVQTGLEMSMRVLANTFIGLGGLLDPATEMRLERRSEDFGQTLGVWGLNPGPFVVLPLFGPSSVRDTAGFVVDRSVALTNNIGDDATRYGVTALQLVNVRAELLDTTGLVDKVALDKYSFIRDAYLARRLDQVFDGNPPLENMDPGDDKEQKK